MYGLSEKYNFEIGHKNYFITNFTRNFIYYISNNIDVNFKWKRYYKEQETGQISGQILINPNTLEPLYKHQHKNPHIILYTNNTSIKYIYNNNLENFCKETLLFFNNKWHWQNIEMIYIHTVYYELYHGYYILWAKYTQHYGKG